MAGYRIISADSHVVEPDDLWLNRIEPEFKDRVPRVVRTETGGDFWFIGDDRFLSLAFAGAQTGKRFEDPTNMSFDEPFENVRPGGYDPDEHVKDMDIDGVDIGIVYPSLGLVLYRIPDSELLSALFRTYNDWVGDFCSANPKRIKGIAMLNVDNVQVGVKELERCAKKGFVGAMITSYPIESKRYYLPEYEPLWAAASDLEMPLSLHAATNRGGSGIAAPVPGEHDGGRAASQCNFDHFGRVNVTDLIFNGVFERYPKLQIGCVEQQVSWAPHLVDRMDYNYKQRSGGMTGKRFKNDMLPSDFFRQNVFIGFQEDALGVQLRDYIGVETLQWGSDYPHEESTFPRSRETLEEILAGCTEEEKALIAGGNAARINRLD
ncbi:MAG: amidohydrolase family protein [Dehalococcoidia bacterium]|nr:amidohydrolase family protein [Dehalococcoidia bacterium]